MKKYRSLLYPCFLFLLLSATTCRKDSATNPDTQYTPLDKDFLSYFAFPKGSWWVYKEINTGQTDSFYVAEYTVANFDNKKANLHYQGASYELVGNKYHGWGSAIPSIYRDTIYNNYSDNYYGVDGFNHSSSRFFYPSKIGYLKGEDMYMQSHNDTISIKGILYRDVYVTAYPSQVYENPIKTEYYCKNTGVIRREFYDGSIWEIIKYHLNK